MDHKNDEKYKRLSAAPKPIASNTASDQASGNRRLICNVKCLNENFLLGQTKEQLVSFILANKDKLMLDADGNKLHKKNYIKKPKKQMNFDE